MKSKVNLHRNNNILMELLLYVLVGISTHSASNGIAGILAVGHEVAIPSKYLYEITAWIQHGHRPEVASILPAPGFFDIDTSEFMYLCSHCISFFHKLSRIIHGHRSLSLDNH